MLNGLAIVWQVFFNILWLIPSGPRVQGYLVTLAKDHVFVNIFKGLLLLLGQF